LISPVHCHGSFIFDCLERAIGSQLHSGPSAIKHIKQTFSGETPCSPV
jgi:hypothetical protein